MQVEPQLQWAEWGRTHPAAPLLRGTQQEVSADSSRAMYIRKRFTSQSSSGNTPCVQKKATFLFMLSLRSLLLPQGCCFTTWIARWQHNPLSSLDVCYHPSQAAIFPRLCQPCCLWSCAERWIREAIQVKNNPAGGWGWAKASATQCNLRSQASESCSQLQEDMKAQPRGYPICYKKYELVSQLKEPCECGRRNPSPVFTRDKRSNLTAHRHQHEMSSRMLHSNCPSRGGFATNANGSVCYSAGGRCLFCGFGRKLP